MDEHGNIPNPFFTQHRNAESNSQTGEKSKISNSSEITEPRTKQDKNKFIPPLKIERIVLKRNVTKKSKRRKQKIWPQFDTDLYCRICGSTESPQWRKGPDQKISLCNACGLHYLANLKSERKIPPNETPQPIPISLILNSTNVDTPPPHIYQTDASSFDLPTHILLGAPPNNNNIDNHDNDNEESEENTQNDRNVNCGEDDNNENGNENDDDENDNSPKLVVQNNISDDNVENPRTHIEKCDENNDNNNDDNNRDKESDHEKNTMKSSLKNTTFEENPSPPP